MKLSSKNMFTDKKPEDFSTVEYLVAMLKAYGIKNIVASPGRQNAFLNSIVQEDTFFEPISIVDERSAAYVATGMAYELNNPVVITCTGATASRNYLSALTEAYYRKIPIIAVTFYDNSYNQFTMSPQYVDRSISQNDIKYVSIKLPVIRNNQDVKNTLVLLNASIVQAVNKSLPIHIDCPSAFNFSDNLTLPTNIWKTEYFNKNFSHIANELENVDFGVFIGAHKRFDVTTEEKLSTFATNWNIPVFCDHTSGYQGANKVLISQAGGMINLDRKPKILIDLGSISGDYCLSTLFKEACIWRVSEDGIFHSRLARPVKKLFDCYEEDFFNILSEAINPSSYYTYIKEKIFLIKIPELPLCNAYICEKLSQLMPKNSSLHLAILNSLRHMNYFDLNSTMSVNSNVGGFGIDGALSTLLGQALINKDRLNIGLIGDLAFFYDMNALGYRDMPNNIRIILVNNNRGEEFRLNNQMETVLGEKTDKLIAAAGHYKNGARAWAESCNFHYMNANTKEEFEAQVESFCNQNFDKPVLFEVFTTVSDEQFGFKQMMAYNRN